MVELDVSSFSFGLSLGIIVSGLLLIIQESNLAIDTSSNLSFGFMVLLTGALLETIFYYKLKEKSKV